MLAALDEPSPPLSRNGPGRSLAWH
jgi:hypothetical protein